MISFMESRKQKAQNVIDNCLDILPEKLEDASAAQVATVMGITIDKFTRQTDAWMDIQKILKNMDTMADIVIHPVENRNISDYEDEKIGGFYHEEKQHRILRHGYLKTNSIL